MKIKSHTGLSLGAIAMSILVPIGTKTLDTTQKIVESKLVHAEAKAKDDAEFKDAVIMDLVERVSELEKQVKSK